MRKKGLKYLFLLSACLFGLAFSACKDGEKPSVETSNSSTSSEGSADIMEVYILSFNDGENTVERSVEVGKVLPTTEIPTPQKKGYFFDGWYNGEKEWDSTQAVEENLTLQAKWTKGVTLTFVSGENVLESKLLYPNTSLSEAEYPDDPTPEKNFSFGAWVDENNNVIDITEKKFKEDTTMYAFFTRIAYSVTFGDKEITVEKSGTSFLLKGSDIPAGEVMEGTVFLGWFAGDIKATINMEITEDMAFEARYVRHADYIGYWLGKDVKLTLSVNDGRIRFGEKEGAYTFDEVSGELRAQNEKRDNLRFNDDIVITLEGEHAKLVNTYYDSVTEEMKTDVFYFVKGQSVSYAGSYHNGNADFVVHEGGVISRYNGAVYYGVMTETSSGYLIEYKANSYADILTATATIDENGNIIIKDADVNARKGLFVKGSTGVKEYFDSDWENYLYFHTVGEGQVCVYRNISSALYAVVTLEGEWEIGNIVSFTVNGEKKFVKVVSSYKIEMVDGEALA